MVGAALFGLIVVGIGVYAMKRAFTVRKRANLVEETPTEDVGAISMGQSEIKGTAKPTDEGTVTAPFSDEECLVAFWEVREFEVSTSSEGDDPDWTIEGNGLDAVPFYVDDGTGKALVRPSEDAVYELERDDEGSTLVEARETPPERIQQFEERDWQGIELRDEAWGLGGWDTEGYSDGDRYYAQHLLTPGEDAYVFGVAQPRDDVRSSENPANVVIEAVPEGDEDLENMFMISDKEEEGIVESVGRGKQWYVAGIVLSVVGLAVFGWGLYRLI